MCDYSLYEYRSRLAVEGEVLVTHLFGSGSIGLISPPNWLAASPEQALDAVTCPVCVAPGTRLSVGVPEPANWLHRLLRLHSPDAAPRECTFIQTSMDVNVHRDALKFDDGSVLKLQHLVTGVRVKVLALAPAEVPAVAEPAAAPVSV